MTVAHDRFLPNGLNGRGERYCWLAWRIAKGVLGHSKVGKGVWMRDYYYRNGCKIN